MKILNRHSHCNSYYEEKKIIELARVHVHETEFIKAVAPFVIEFNKLEQFAH